MNAHIQSQPNDQAIVAKAVLRAGALLELSQKELADVLGCSAPTVSRMARQQWALAPASKENEIALLFLRIYRSLDALFGGREHDIRAWFTSYNDALAGIPRELVKSLNGLFSTVRYLDAMRGKV